MGYILNSSKMLKYLFCCDLDYSAVTGQWPPLGDVGTAANRIRVFGFPSRRALDFARVWLDVVLPSLNSGRLGRLHNCTMGLKLEIVVSTHLSHVFPLFLFISWCLGTLCWETENSFTNMAGERIADQRYVEAPTVLYLRWSLFSCSGVFAYSLPLWLLYQPVPVYNVSNSNTIWISEQFCLSVVWNQSNLNLGTWSPCLPPPACSAWNGRKTHHRTILLGFSVEP